MNNIEFPLMDPSSENIFVLIKGDTVGHEGYFVVEYDTEGDVERYSHFNAYWQATDFMKVVTNKV